MSDPAATLRSRHLWHFKPKQCYLSSLRPMPSLQEFELTQSTIASLHGAERFVALVDLELDDCRSLSSPSLGTWPPLRRLYCERCPALRNYADLSRATTLRSLSLNSCAPIESLEFLDDLRELERFIFVDTDVADGNLGHLLHQARLEHTAFTSKKHFSHNKSEIQNAIAARMK